MPERRGFRVTEQVEVIAPHVIGALEFRDCRIPAESLIGRSGEGFKIAMGVLDIYRSTVAAAALGFAKRALQEAIAHVRKRKLFGQTLADFQATRMRLADMAAELEFGGPARLSLRLAQGRRRAPRHLRILAGEDGRDRARARA